MRFSQIKLVTFDVTNTLLSFKMPPWRLYAKIAEQHGAVCTEETLRCRFRYKYKQMWTNYPNFGKNSRFQWEEWWREIVRYTLADNIKSVVTLNLVANILINEYKTARPWSLAVGTEPLLNLLKEKQVFVGIISNFDPRLHTILENLNLLKKFDFIITSYEADCVKPDLRIFQKALEASNANISPCMCMHIGNDLLKDYEGALAAGWHSILISETHWPGLPQDHIFSNLTHLNSAIQKDELLLQCKNTSHV